MSNVSIAPMGKSLHREDCAKQMIASIFSGQFSVKSFSVKSQESEASSGWDLILVPGRHIANTRFAAAGNFFNK